MITAIEEYEFENKTIPMTSEELEDEGGYPLKSIYLEISGEEQYDTYGSDADGNRGETRCEAVDLWEIGFFSDEKCENALPPQEVPQEARDYALANWDSILMENGE